MTNQESLAQIAADCNTDSDDYDFDNADYLEEYEVEEWSGDGKYQFRQVIYWHKEAHVYIAVNESRTGSYYTDYSYYLDGVDIVEKRERVVTKTITEWICV